MKMFLENDKYSYYMPGTNGRGVLLLHGITGAPVEMKMLARKLNRAGYSVYAPLLAGHGQGLKGLHKSRWQDWLAGADLSFQKLNKEVDQVFIAGMCLGGLLGMRLAYQNQNVTGVAVYSPALKYDGWNVPFYYHASTIAVPLAVKLGLGQFINFKERSPYGIKSDRIRRHLIVDDGVDTGLLPAFPLETLYENYKLVKNIKKLLPKMSTPSLLIHSKVDDLASPSNSAFIKEHIGGRCEVIWLDDSYHMIHIDQESDSVARYTEEFFNAL